MTVYILQDHRPYEDTYTHGVFSSREHAAAFAKVLVASGHVNPENLGVRVFDVDACDAGSAFDDLEELGIE